MIIWLIGWGFTVGILIYPELSKQAKPSTLSEDLWMCLLAAVMWPLFLGAFVCLNIDLLHGLLAKDEPEKEEVESE